MSERSIHQRTIAQGISRLVKLPMQAVVRHSKLQRDENVMILEQPTAATVQRMSKTCRTADAGGSEAQHTPTGWKR
jgi:hypothetical protein